jgi:peptidoglycan/LPS O-acetylase OafA/YrhL
LAVIINKNGATLRIRDISTSPKLPKAARLDNLDLLRGSAALLVLSGHLRSFIFQSYDELVQASLSIKAFYFVTGLGHQSVIIFFALSGFLVGGKSLDDILNRRFSWLRYLIRRLTRLWIVIIPALCLTLIFDNVGSWLTHGSGYDGRYYGIYSSGPPAATGVNHSLITFLGNVAFLQTIYVPTFGSNGPMWSLANEFWYYVVFPLAAWVGLTRATVLVKMAAVCILFVTIMVLPLWLLAGGIVWVAGAVAAWCARRDEFTKFLRHFTTRIAVVPLLFAALAFTKAGPNEIGDLELGIIVAMILPVLATLPSPGGLYSAVARSSSELSYTLYLTHFPLLAFIVLAGFAPNKLPPNTFSSGLYVALLLAALVWATILWWCFERNTDRVYSLIASTLSAPPTPIRERKEA